MNRNILIGAAIAAGSAALIYLIRKNRKAKEKIIPSQVRRSRHLTDVFSKHKQL